jgi:hypothetical protein
MCRELHERTESMDERFRRVKRRVNVHVSENDLCVLTVCDSERRWVGTTGFLDFFGLLLERFVCLFRSLERGFGMGTELRICGLLMRCWYRFTTCLFTLGVVTPAGD